MTKRTQKKLLPHIIYQAGFTGQGPSAFIPKPPEKPRLTAKERLHVKRMVDYLRPHLRESFRESCLEVLGEDPDDWGLTIEQFDQKEADRFHLTIDAYHVREKMIGRMIRHEITNEEFDAWDLATNPYVTNMVMERKEERKQRDLSQSTVAE